MCRDRHKYVQSSTVRIDSECNRTHRGGWYVGKKSFVVLDLTDLKRRPR
jgi:hypothetical protein